jgi:hypothetical protein
MNFLVNNKKDILLNIIIFSILAVLVTLVTTIYINSENTIYWWDFAGYNNAANNLTNLFQESPSKAINEIIKSLSLQKNFLVTLPTVPFLYIFGKTRLAYILSLTLFYLLPFALVTGAIARKLISKLITIQPRKIYWLTVILALLIPINWATVLRGYTDTGGALFLWLAVVFYLYNIDLKKWWQIPTIGILLAISILLRRHFSYGVIAVLIGIAGEYLLSYFYQNYINYNKSINNPTFKNLLTKDLKNISIFLIKVSLIALSCFFTITIVAQGFVKNSLTEDYRTLYSAWALSFGQISWRYVWFYGLGTLILSFIGFIWGTKKVLLQPRITLFLAIYTIFSAIEWLIILRYGNIHYALHFTPVIVLGLIAFLVNSYLYLSRKPRLIVLIITSLYLIINIIIGLTDINKFGSFNNSPIRPLFANSFPPLKRNDISEILKLNKYIYQLAAPKQELVYIVAASNQLNASIINNTSRIIEPENWWKLRAISKPHIDSRDTYPLPELLSTQYVLLPQPFQGVLLTDEQVLKQGEQDVVKVVYDAFNENWQIAQDFQKLPEQFTLDNGVIVHIYQRIKPTNLPTTIQTFEEIKKRVGEIPGRQLDWITFQQSPHIDVNYRAVEKVANQAGNNIYTLQTLPSDQLSQTAYSFLYINQLPAQIKLTGNIDFLKSECLGINLRFSLLDNAGNIINSVTQNYLNNNTQLDLSIVKQNANYLLLEVLDLKNQPIGAECHIKINNLQIN